MSITPLSSVLTRLSYELHALAEATDEFHHLAFDGDGQKGLDDANYVRATQSIDHTQQILANLSDFVACLALASPEHMKLDTAQALSLLTLSDLRLRLADAPAADTERQAAGEPELFF